MPAARPIRDDVPAEELRRLARREANGRVASRLLGVAHALEGMERGQAARLAGMDRQTLRDWVIRFNAEGIDGLRDRPKSGRPPWLDEGQLASLRALVLRGPDPERDGVSTWRAKDLCRIVAARFGVAYSENGMLRLLHDLGLPGRRRGRSIPRPTSRRRPASKKIPDADRRGGARPPRGRAARGLVPRRSQGRPDRSGLPALVRARAAAPRGARPPPPSGLSVRAVCPERDVGVALVLPTVGAAAMQAMLDELAQAVRPGAHAVVLMDRAGRHIAKTLTVPANLTPLFLPPYSPELNAIERLWLHLRERFLSHRLWPTYDAILDACCAAWNALLDDTGRIRSLCTLDWATVTS